ncbi:MAG: hypothetical protein R3C02_26340 [Planctomycetaceae bacterium]|nr:hypothetical protein [Planctomycetaceae bacterium]
MPYLKLFHGRERPDEQLDDWGEPGPIFGPYPYFHATYQSDIKFEDERGVLTIVGDLVYYDGMFYGDWSVFDGPVSDEDAHRHILFESDKAVVPDKFRLCACMEPGYFHCGVPGVLAHLENGRVPPDAKVERCDQCGRYPSDHAARAVLLEQGLLAEQSPQLFDVHCYATVRVKFCEIMASTPLDAARIGMALFDWDQHQQQADFVDELSEFLVDIVGADDFSGSKRFNADLEEIDT